MNLVGKIFIVLIMLMSVVFMGLAVAVYATHQNWERMVNLTKEEASGRQPVGLKYQLEEATTKRGQLEQQLALLTEQHKTELASRTAKLAQLETEAKELRTELDGLQNQHATLVQQARDSVAAMESTQQTLAANRKELDLLRQQIRDAQTDRDAQFKQFVKLTDDYNQAQGELKRLKAQTMTLADQIAQYRAVANRLGINLERRPEDVQPKLDGVVLAGGRDGMVEISLGADDGLERGHIFDVSRGARYVGRIEVFETLPDKSVAKILPQFRKGAIEKDDHVRTPIN